MRYRDPDFDIDWDLKIEKGYCLNALGESKFEINEQGDCGSRGLAASGFVAVDLSSGGKTLRFAMP